MAVSTAPSLPGRSRAGLPGLLGRLSADRRRYLCPQLGISLDDDAARKIVSRCQNTDGSATVEEITHFAELKVQQLARRKNIENWPGMLMAAVPAYFNPPATEVSRYRAEKRREREKEEQLAREILADPNAEHLTDADKEWARSIVSFT
jgi:hypothetical protein